MFYYIVWQLCLFYSINTLYTLNTKQKAHILSLTNAIILSSFGLLHNLFYIDYYPINIFMLNHFTSFLITDLALSQLHYKQYMNILSGYIHHIVYIFINYYALITNLIVPYQLFFILEIPTLILDLGSINNKYRSNLLFGLNMFLFRIVYHLYLTYSLYYSSDILFFSLLAFSTHTYWFTNWINKYLFN